MVQRAGVMPPNFTLLDATLPDVARLLIAMVQARDAVESRSWSHPQQPTTEEAPESSGSSTACCRLATFETA